MTNVIIFVIVDITTMTSYYDKYDTNYDTDYDNYDKKRYDKFTMTNDMS